MELSIKILHELVVLPHWQLLVHVTLTAISLLTAASLFMVAMHHKYVSQVKEKEIIQLYQEKARLKHELGAVESALVSK